MNNMGVPTKLLLLSKEDLAAHGSGLKAIREMESSMMDLPDDFPDHLDDATSSTNWQRVIKDNVVYKIIKTYFDLDNERRIIMASEDMNPQDDLSTDTP